MLRLPRPSDAIRIEASYTEGDTITPFYDPMIAKIITLGGDRSHAIQKMLSALEQCQIEDVATNLSLLKAILKDPAFEDARANTTYLEQNITTLMGL